MSKGLEALEYLKNKRMIHINAISRGCVEDIEKELKALTIIKRDYDAGDLYYDDESDTYWYLGLEVTKEEYDLLWEVFTND